LVFLSSTIAMMHGPINISQAATLFNWAQHHKAQEWKQSS